MASLNSFECITSRAFASVLPVAVWSVFLLSMVVAVAVVVVAVVVSVSVVVSVAMDARNCHGACSVRTNTTPLSVDEESEFDDVDDVDDVDDDDDDDVPTGDGNKSYCMGS